MVGQVTARDPWNLDAACLDADPEWFFPEHGHNPRLTARRAKAICAGCLVRRECAAHALASEEPAGIWGGLDERERKELLRAARPPVPGPHCGTPAGAYSHYHRREQVCGPCRDAAAQQATQRRLRRKGIA
jgi:WhiB family transcriptional regulator, redox-sensing transcriptional regulator